MALFKIIFACAILKAQMLCYGSLVDMTSSDFDGFVNTMDTRVVYFETKDSQAKFPSFDEEYAEAAKSLDSYGVQFAKLNCSTEKHEHCSKKEKPRLLIFRDGKLLKSLKLKKVSEEDTIVANILHRFLLKEELLVVQDEKDFKEILQKSKGKRNVILVNIKGIGMKDHRNVLEVAFAFGDSFKFCLTTVLPRDMFGYKSKLKVFLCKEKDCEARHYDDQLKIVSLATFLQFITVSQITILGEDEKIPYNSDASFPINKVYMFVKDEKDIAGYIEELEKVGNNVKAAVGFIVVEVEKHQAFIRRFGLTEDSGFPSLGFVSGHRFQNEELEHVDVFTSHDKAFATKDTADFIRNLVIMPHKIYGESVNTRSLTVRVPVEYVSLVNELELDYLLMAFCKPSVEACADAFIYDYQRLSRTFDRHFQRESIGEEKRVIQFAIIYSSQDMDPKFNIDLYPTMRLHKKGESVTEFTPFNGVFDYYEMLEFVKQVTGEARVLTLPSSGLDLIELDNLQAVEDHTETPTRSGDDTDGSRGESEDYDDEEKPPEETEDDEVAAAGYEMYYTKAVKDEHVPKLNDTSFNATIQNYDISVIFFFLPWDARSQAFSPSYAAAAKTLGEADGSDTKIGALQVNCYDWEDVCRKENIKLYPTVRIYRDKKPSIDYHGSLDESSLVKSVKLLQSPLPVKLTSDGEAVGFKEGKYPMPSILYTDISIIGLFALESSVEVPSFQSAAKMMQGQFLFGYATGKIALDTSSRLGVVIPSIVLVKRNDPLQSLVVFPGDYTEDDIVNFVKHSSLPLFGELTPLNFPNYFSREQPFLIAFRKRDDVEIESVISNVAKSGGIVGISFCWVDITVKVNRDILETYTKSEQQGGEVSSAIVIVNHQKGKTYTYREKLRKDTSGFLELVSWINHCLSESEDFTGELEFSEWKPRLEGYDFLAKMKDDAEEEGESNASDRWESEAEADDEDDEETTEDSSTNPATDQDHEKFHKAFHAKKQSRLDQRRRIPSKAPVHDTHTEL